MAFSPIMPIAFVGVGPHVCACVRVCVRPFERLIGGPHENGLR